MNIGMPANGCYRVAVGSRSRPNTDGGEADALAGVEVADAPIGSALLQAVRPLAARAAAELTPLGLSPPQELVLLHCAEHGPVNQADLVRYLGRDRSTVTNMLQAMERSGLVTRQAVATDRRTRVVELLDAGRDLVPAVHAVWTRLESDMAAAVSRNQRRALLDALALVRDALLRGADLTS
jgi:DNA-binding MarR family transcriptional regulator